VLRDALVKIGRVKLVQKVITNVEMQESSELGDEYSAQIKIVSAASARNNAPAISCHC
jgi:hypothetical protein